MTELHESDAMICRSCGYEERASEGYPCTSCGTFICLMCMFRGVVLCRECADVLGKPQPQRPRPPGAPAPPDGVAGA